MFDKFRPAIAHHLTLLGDDISYQNVRFLNAAQGLEALHRRLFPGEYESTKKYKKTTLKALKKAIPPDLPEPYRKSIRDGLIHLNEYSFRVRVTELYEKHRDLVDFAFKAPEEEIDRIVKVRNHLTHLPPRSNEFYRSKNDFLALLNLSDRCRLLLEAAILARLTTRREKAREWLESAWFMLH